MDFGEYFKDKKVLMVRLGLLGRGVGDAAFLSECGAEVLVVDDAPAEVMRPSVEALKEHPNVTFKFGPYDAADVEGRDFVLVGAGTPLDCPILIAAQEQGVPLKQSAALFTELAKIPVIGVTGTRGKSTVTHMVHHVLTQVTGEHIILGGNVRGVSNLQLLKEVKEDSLAVMELDSWQLQGFGWANISPHIAVFTNFMEDHLNYYGGDMDAYFADKANVFLYQEEPGVFITTPKVFEHAKEFAKGRDITLGQEVVLADKSVLPEDCLLSMPGEHNRLNAALAYEALKATSLTDEEIFDGLASFPGVPGRLQYLKEVNGVKIYNDNNATTPSATIAALRALGEKQNVILIAGGTDKGLNTDELLEEIPRYCKNVVLLPGTGTDKLLQETENITINRNILENVDSLSSGLKKALSKAVKGDVVLFSPGFASFGMFKNEYERGDQFVDMVNSL